MSRWIRAVCATMAAATMAAGASACGGDDDSTASQQQQRYSAAAEAPDTFAARMAKLLETAKTPQDCAELEAINARSVPRFKCPPDKGISKSMASFDVVGAEEYGTGAVVDYKSGDLPDGAAIVLHVAPDRNWGVSRFGVVTEPSTETSDEESRAGFRKAVDDYLAAIRTRDCEAFVDVAFTGDDKQTKVCKDIFPATKGLAKRLKTDAAAEPKYEGGNATYGFLSLETRKPDPANVTITVLKTGAKSSPYVVLDIAQSPTAKEQREVVEALKRSRKQKRQQPKPGQAPAPAPATTS